MGLVIDSESLAAGEARKFEEELKPENSRQVLPDQEKQLYWRAGERILRREPARSLWQRLQSGFFGLFDLDDQL